MLTSLCIVAFLVQAGYLGWLLMGTPARPSAPLTLSSSEPGPLPALTVIIAVRNERPHLPALTQALHSQTHQAMHIVWVNDHSSDGSAAWLDAYAADYPNVQVVHHTGTPGKKHALGAGIQAAPTTHLAFTDADCIPPPTWLETLARIHQKYRDEQADGAQSSPVLVGPSLLDTPRGLLQRLAGYETWTAQIAMLAAAQHGHPYMAVGRNISYSGAAYHRVSGHDAHSVLLSGDDDLFVQAAHAQGLPVRAVWRADAQVPTAPPTSWSRWLRAQRRHTSTGRAYARGPALHLTAYYASALLLWMAPLLAGPVGAGLLALRLIGISHLLHRGANVLRADAPTVLFPLWDAAHTVLRIGTSAAGLLVPPTRWSSR